MITIEHQKKTISPTMNTVLVAKHPGSFFYQLTKYMKMSMIFVAIN